MMREELAPGVGFEPTRLREPTAVLVPPDRIFLNINLFRLVPMDIDVDCDSLSTLTRFDD